MESTFTPLGRMRRTDYAVNLGVINLAMIGVSTVVEEDSVVMGILRKEGRSRKCGRAGR